jgi:hypothetical protein
MFFVQTSTPAPVLRGLVPRIHVFASGVQDVDHRVEPGEDDITRFPGPNWQVPGADQA